MPVVLMEHIKNEGKEWILASARHLAKITT
jgi:hypothetical protein